MYDQVDRETMVRVVREKLSLPEKRCPVCGSSANVESRYQGRLYYCGACEGEAPRSRWLWACLDSRQVTEAVAAMSDGQRMNYYTSHCEMVPSGTPIYDVTIADLDAISHLYSMDDYLGHIFSAVGGDCSG